MPGLVTAGDPPWGTTNYQRFWVLLPDDFPVERDELLLRLRAAGVGARRGSTAAHLEPAWTFTPGLALPGIGNGAPWRSGDLEQTERFADQSIVLPLYHELTEAEQDRVVEVVREAAR